MTKKVNSEQIEDWREQLTLAMANRQWRRALQLCSWLRYALEGQPDPDVEQLHQRAKEALAEQVVQQRAQQAYQTEHRRLRRAVANHLASGTWMKALDSIERMHERAADRQELFGLLQELQLRLSDRLLPTHWEKDPTAKALATRFNDLLAKVREDA